MKIAIVHEYILKLMYHIFYPLVLKYSAEEIIMTRTPNHKPITILSIGYPSLLIMADR